MQLDRGLYGPLIVEDSAEPGAYDHEWTVVLDDWIDGTGCTPDQVLAALRSGMSGMGGASASPSPSMSGMGGSAAASMSPTAGAADGRSGPVLLGAPSPLLGGDAGDVRCPFYLINGRVRAAPRTFTA